MLHLILTSFALMPLLPAFKANQGLADWALQFTLVLVFGANMPFAACFNAPSNQRILFQYLFAFETIVFLEQVSMPAISQNPAEFLQ